MKSIATVFGVGYIPGLPGTAGSAVGLGVAWALRSNPIGQLVGCAAVSALALWSSGPAARKMGKADPSAIVIDEVAGMMVGVALLPATWQLYLAGFILFRFFDIVKPPPIRRLERLPGSIGILADDLAAGLATQLVLRLVLPLFS